jgi:hypothetical protein
MSKTKGVLLFAHNNTEMDYIKFAVLSGSLVKKFLDVPVSLVTSKGSYGWFSKSNSKYKDIFDKIIFTDSITTYTNQKRNFYDGSTDYKIGNFDNGYRSLCYELSPYDKTLVIDTDLLILNDRLKTIWDTDCDFMINRFHYDLSRDRDGFEFKKISDYSINFYWATAFYFEKTETTKIFFDLCQHILENYNFYKFVYQIDAGLVRNDYIFSIAIHIMGGFSNKVPPMKLPCDIYYTLDTDNLFDISEKNELIFLIQKKNLLGEYIISKTTNQTVHIMNKYSLGRNFDKLLGIAND